MSISNVDTVLVEQSDDRLAAVEEAKRTGLPFESKGAKGTNVVPYEVAEAIAEEKALQNSYIGSFGQSHAGHLQDYHTAIAGNPEFVTATNEEKARAHEEYSAQLVRERMITEAGVASMLAQGYDVSLAVQQANLERAEEHGKYSAEYERKRQENEKSATAVLDVVDETLTLLNSGKLDGASTKSEVVAEMVKLSSVVVPDAMETPAQDALILKDQIISTEIPYEAEVANPELLNVRDRPALVVLSSVGSPEELVESTVDAQIAAGNTTQASLNAQRDAAEKTDKS